MTDAIAMHSVSKSFEHFSLEDINLTLPQGEIMGLVGVNGAGKSTMLRLLMGLIRADGGEVRVLGHEMPREQVAAKWQIGYAAEDMRLYKGKTLGWHMNFIRTIYPSWDEAYALELAPRFDLPINQLVGGFSHGQRVKAMLLLILSRRPQLLLLDEPTTGLDPVARVEVLEALADILRDEARSVLFSSHDTRDIEQLSDSITFMHNGRLLASQDKEGFIDSWRRLLCYKRGYESGGQSYEDSSGQWQVTGVAMPEIAHVRQNGSLVELKVRRYTDSVPERLNAMGLEIKSVDAMNLEDIFVTIVRSGEAA